MMTIVSFTSASTPQPWDSSLASPTPPPPSVNRFGPSPLGLGTWDEERDVISPGEKGRKDGGIWDGPTALEASLAPVRDQTPSRTSDGNGRRKSRLQRAARSQGEEDSRGLVTLEDLERGRETEGEEEEESPPVGTFTFRWDPNRRKSLFRSCSSTSRPHH